MWKVSFIVEESCLKKFVVVSGIDGSGKTTIIEALQKRLQEKGFSCFYIWMRYNHVIIKPVHALCRLVGLSRRRQTSQGKIWRHEFYRCQLFCSVYIFLTWLDTWLGRIILAWQLKGPDAEIIICDRWVNDIIIDLAVKSHRPDLIDSGWYCRFQQIQPKNTTQFVIERDITAVLECRLENHDDHDFDLRQNVYTALMKNSDVVKVDNTGTIDDSVDQILTHLFD